MDFATQQRIREEEQVRHKERQRLQAQQESSDRYEADRYERTQGHIDMHGRFGAWLLHVAAWLVGWTMIAIGIVFWDIAHKDWHTFWDDFRPMLGTIISGYVICGALGIWRAGRYL